MPNPEYLSQLIDLASKAAGNDNQLAAAIGTDRQSISNWRHGRKHCPVADQVLMAEIAGLEPEAWAARAIISGYEGTKRERLERALKKSLVATGVAIALSGQAAAAMLPAPNGAGSLLYTMYRKLRCLGRKDRNTVPLRYMGFHPIPHPMP